MWPPGRRPDGQLVAYMSMPSITVGNPEVVLKRDPATAARWQVSSGGGSHPRWSHMGGHAEAILAAVTHGVVVHVICLKSWWDSSVAPPGETFVKPLADETGGLLRLDDAFEREPWDKPTRIFRDILDAIHNTYEIRLNVTDGADGVHPLEVRAHVPNLRVHAPRWLQIGTPRPGR